MFSVTKGGGKLLCREGGEGGASVVGARGVRARGGGGGGNDDLVAVPWGGCVLQSAVMWAWHLYEKIAKDALVQDICSMNLLSQHPERVSCSVEARPTLCQNLQLLCSAEPVCSTRQRLQDASVFHCCATVKRSVGQQGSAC